MKRVDAHQHFWRLSRGDYGWLTPELGPIHRDFLPPDLEPLLQRHDIAATVLVQAAPTEAETRFMLSLADAHPFVEGVVGWTDFAAADAPAAIARLARHPKLKGLRPMIQDIADADWMLRPELEPAFRALVVHDLVFDALVLPRHLGNLLALARRHPDLRIVVDHCAKPAIAAGGFSGWADDIGRIAAETGAACKLSGLVTEAGADWSAERLRPYVDHVLSIFGPGRVVWGSDWPVSTLAAGYEDWVAATGQLLDGWSDEEREAILGGNAVRVYGLEPS
jgi:L-fuconolactonase